MKNLITLVLVCCFFYASAQISTSSQKSQANNSTCAERGHKFVNTKTETFIAPYIINTKDSTVTVYPVPNSVSKCLRCGLEVQSPNKEMRITTWKRVEKDPEQNDKATAAALASIKDKIDWGVNPQRALNANVISSSLNDIKKVATLKNDTLFIHKRITPFTSLKEQVNAVTTLYYKNNPITFKTAVFDEAAFYCGKNGLEIF